MAWLRRIGVLALALVCCEPQVGGAQNYPNRPVTVVVPYAAGGGTDLVTRLVAQKLSERLGQSFVVENRLGAGGLIASSAVAHAAPDGYTLLLGTDAQLAIQVTLRKSMPYDPTRDFVPVALIGTTPFGLVVSRSLPTQSVGDLIKLAKENPGHLSFGSSGPGGVPHLLAELFMSNTGTKMTHVPYKGTAQALNDLAGGRVPVLFSGLVPVMGLLKGGQIRVLGVTSAKRIPALPEVPVMAEAGVPGFVVTAWLMIVAPANTPKSIVDKLHAEIATITTLPEIRDQFGEVGYFSPDPLQQGELNALIRSEIDRWGKVIQSAGLAHSQ